MAKGTNSIIGMSGEFAVASELLRRGFQANVTFGNAKAMDIIITSNNSNVYKIVEVKTTTGPKFVTEFFKKYYDKSVQHPDYWVLVFIDKDFTAHYYVLTHEEIGDIQMQANGKTSWEKNDDGVDNIRRSNPALAEHKNRWDKIVL